MTAIDSGKRPAGLPRTDPFTIESVTVDVYRSPIARPVRTAFGTMTDRPAVTVTVRSTRGFTGYGEVWCNFPAPGAEYRARLIATVLRRAVTGREWSGPVAVFHHLTARTRVLAIQAAEPGPFAQSIAGMDIALWDMVARRARQPLWRFLGGEGNGHLPVYASGIGPDRAIDQALESRAAGHRAFKLKIGFDQRRDLANLAGLRRTLGGDASIAVDANQAWSPEEAVRRSRDLAPYSPAWLEEPIRADRGSDDWQLVARGSPIALAAGENILGEEAFDRLIGGQALAVIQPDVTKWGGISGCLPVARRIVDAGKRYCPHHLGGGIGLLASAHLLAAAGGDGLLEVDCNHNPLREGLAQPFPRLADGRLWLSDAPGLGVAPDDALSGLKVDWNR